jgi:hypothetical protein
VILSAITIDPHQAICVDLSETAAMPLLGTDLQIEAEQLVEQIR